MYPAWVSDLALLALLAWVGLLSYLFFQERESLRRLFPEDSGRDIRQKLKEVLATLQEVGKREEIINRNIRQLSRANLLNVQKVALVRYNPYHDTGGNVSFTAVLLDGKGTGLVLTSLHVRSGTRVYAKAVNEGTPELQLSEEEQEALNKALNE